MIDEIDMDEDEASDNVAKTRVEISTTKKLKKYESTENYSGIGLHLLKQSSEVAREFNQANY